MSPLPYFIVLIAAMSLLNGCASNTPPEASKSPEDLYRDAILDAMVADDDERSSSLVCIRRDNPNLVWSDIGGEQRVLVTTWTAWDTNHSAAQSAKATYDMWVTTVPEVKTWWHTRYDGRTDTTLRLEQLLGLAPGRKKTHFLLAWVRPSDMFRPAGDSEIDDATASSELPTTADSSYRTWFNSSIIYSYFPKTSPWTRLGYTYDWNRQYGEQGTSEFIVRKGAELIIHSVQKTSEYLR